MSAMKSATTTAVSGCVIWFILISVITSCILPVFFIAGSVSSFSDFAINTTGNWLCPDGTVPQSYSYQTTTHDENGFERPTTAYELHCVDAGGTVVKRDPIVYAFLWIGLFALAGLIVSAVLSFVFAVPGGMLVTKLLNKLKPSRAATDINT